MQTTRYRNGLYLFLQHRFAIFRATFNDNVIVATFQARLGICTEF